MTEEATSPWKDLVGNEIVVDLASPYVVIGLLSDVQGDFLIFGQVDVHDLRDTTTTRDRYVRETRLHGIHANRTHAWVSLGEVVACSRLADVHVE